MNIGLLLVAGEDDILERVLAEHETIVDCFYAIDGSVPNTESEHIICESDKCAGYWTDDQIHEPYPAHAVDGYRGFIYEEAVAEHGCDHWFLILHGDEIWTFNPADPINGTPNADGFVFNLPYYFPRVDEPWQKNIHPLDQLHWRTDPGWPEFRMFRGNPDVWFNPTQHFNTQPYGLRNVVHSAHRINHYPYRSPESQRAKAKQHMETGFDPDNYRHITNGDNVYWTESMIADARCDQHRMVVG